MMISNKKPFDVHGLYKNCQRFNSVFTSFAFMRKLPPFTKFAFMRNPLVYMH